MTLDRKFFWVAFFCLAILASAPASAYVDPGSGSFFVQIIVAFLVGTLFYVKALIQRVLCFFRPRKKDPTTL